MSAAEAALWPVGEWKARSTTLVAGAGWVFQPGIGLACSFDPASHLGRLLEAVPPGGVLHLHPTALGHLDGGLGLEAAGLQGWSVRGPASDWRYVMRRGEAGPWRRAVIDAAAPNDAAGPWHRAATAELASGALARWLAHVGTPFLDTVGRTAERLILSTHPREKGGTQLERDLALPAECSERMEGPWASWRRDLTPAEARAGYVHSYDVNAAYLPPWQSAELGLGPPVEVGGSAVGTLGEHLPGIYELEAATPDTLEREPLPLLPPVWTRPGERYVTSVTLRRIAEVYGHAPRVTRGWAWPTHSRYLRGAGELLRDARAGLMEEAPRNAASALALQAVKQTYRVFVGRLSSDYVHDERSAWRRPDWGHLIRASARTNLHRRLSKLAGAAPFAVVVDGLVFASDEADPHAFAQRIGLPIGSGLGQHSVTGSWKAGPHSTLGKAIRSAPTGRKVMGVLMEAGRA